jgi:glycopeptide antibiotics resistance protein
MDHTQKAFFGYIIGIAITIPLIILEIYLPKKFIKKKNKFVSFQISNKVIF